MILWDKWAREKGAQAGNTAAESEEFGRDADDGSA